MAGIAGRTTGGILMPSTPKPAPAGYTYDPRNNLVPFVGSAQDALTQRARQQSLADENQAYMRQQRAYPPGYTTDPNSGTYVPIVGSGSDLLEQRRRQQGLDDAARARTIQLQERDYADKQPLRQRLLSMLDRPLETAAYGGGGGGGGGGDAMPTIAPIALPDTSVAQANIFARAKDKVGQETSGSLASLRSALAGRGMLGGGAEVRGAQNVLMAGQGQLGDTTREQAVQEANRLTDFAKTGYEGAIAQRGQDISMRGQNLSAANAAAERAANANRTRYEGVTNLLGRLY